MTERLSDAFMKFLQSMQLSFPRKKKIAFFELMLIFHTVSVLVLSRLWADFLKYFVYLFLRDRESEQEQEERGAEEEREKRAPC